MDALVYVNHGRVIMDCPYGCGNAYKYRRGQASQKCTGPGGCNYDFGILVDSSLPEICQELAKRPNPVNRNWFPEGHPLAVRGGLPMGQSVADLAQEFEMEREADGLD
jgi:hypothetical protein